MSAEISYFRALATLSGRSLDQLSAEDFEQLREAFAIDIMGWSGWRAALGVVEEVLACQVAQAEPGARPAPSRFAATFVALDRLPADRRKEINRHLATIVSGAVRDGLDARRAAEIRAQRLGNGRGWRAPLFFEPEPEPPRLRRARPPQIEPAAWVRAVGGAFLAIIGLALVLAASAPSGVLWPLIVLVLAGSGAGGVAILLPRLRYEHERLATADQHAPAAMQPMVSPDFGAEIDALLDRRFGALDKEGRYRKRLRSDILRRYSDLATERSGAERLDWLIRWHAHRVSLDPAGGTLLGSSGPVALPLRERLGLFAAFVGLILGVVTGWLAALHGDIVVGLAVLPIWGSAATLLNRSTVIYVERRRWAEEEAANANLHEAEGAAYEAALARLDPRPTDGEMATWLDYDKDYIRTEAMKLYGLSNTDVIAQVVLAEPAPSCHRARDLGGPTRYSAYVIQLFLMTGNGVRQFAVHLDFASGAENKPRRIAFRYDAVASLQVDESSVRPHGRRQIASPEGGGPSDRLPRPILHGAVQLSLVNNQQIVIKVDFDSLVPYEHREDPEVLQRLALQSSGVINALRTLESIAAEGRGWIGRERERYRHSVADYARCQRE
jgi:hypothetical protein